MAAETRRGSVPARLPLLPAWVCCPGHPALVRSLRHLPVVPALGPVQEKVQAVCTAAFRALCVLPAMHTQLAGVSALWLDVGSGQGAGCLGARVPCWRQRSGGIRGQFSRGSQRPLGGGQSSLEETPQQDEERGSQGGPGWSRPSERAGRVCGEPCWAVPDTGQGPLSRGARCTEVRARCTCRPQGKGLGLEVACPAGGGD